MTALSTQRMTQSKWQGPAQSYPMGVAKIYVGSLVMINSAGYAVPASALAGNKGVVGVATETQDNTGGSAGDKWIDVREGCYKFACTTATQPNVGSACFAEDDQTVDTVQQEGEPSAGIIVEYVSTSAVWVAVGLAYRKDAAGAGGGGAMTLVAGADLSTKQYYAMKAGTGGTDYVSVCSVAGEAAIGILQNAPAAAGTDALVATSGLAMFYTTSGVTRGDALSTNSSGTLETTTEGQVILGYALETVGATSTGHMIVDIGGMTKALASGKLLVGNSSGIATAVAMSGDVTISNTGATTIGNDKVTAAMMSTSSAGVIFKGAAANAVTELQLTTGLIPIGTSNDVTTLDLSGTAGDIIVSNGTTGTVVAVTGDVTINGSGVTAIGNDKVTAAMMSTTSAGVIFKGAAANAVTELQLTEGLIPIGTTNDVTTIDMGATAGNILVDNGTTAASVSVSGDATLAGNGALTVTDVTVGSDATGDLLYKSSATALTRLGIGSGAQKLIVKPSGTGVASTAIAWDSGITVKANLTGMDASNDPVLTGTDWTAADLATGNLNRCQLFDGTTLGYYILGAGQTIEGPVGATDAIDVAADQTDNEGLEIFSNYLFASGAPICVHHTAAFYFLVKLNIATINGCDDLFVGFRKAEGVQVNMEDYDTFFGFGLNTAASPGALKTRNELNGGGADNTDSTQTIASATDLQIKVLVSATGVATILHDAAVPGTLAAPSTPKAFTFDNGDIIVPTVRFLHATAAQAGAILIKNWEVGLQ